MANELPSLGVNANKSTMVYFTAAWKVPIIPGAEGMESTRDDSTKTVNDWAQLRLNWNALWIK